MSARPPENDPKKVWRSQEGEQPTMSVQEFRERLRKLQAKSQRDAIKNIVIGLGVISIFAFNFFRVQALLERFAFGLFIIGTLVVVFPHVVSLMRRTPRETLPSDIALTAGIQYYRRLLRPQVSYDKWTALCLLFVFFGTMLILIPGVAKAIENPNSQVSILNIVPFSVLAIAWCISFFAMRRRQQRRLQRELDLLTALEKENP